MDDLISRSALIEKLKEKSIVDEVNILSTTYTYKELVYIISNQPTAFDVEKVVENINNIDTRRNWNSSCEECINHTTCKEIYNEEAKTKSNHLCSQVIKKLAIKEVRKGGME